MNRELKFRAWNGTRLNYSDRYSSLESFFAFHNQNDCSGIIDDLMQYIGQLDHKKIEIYEGDIVEHIYRDGRAKIVYEDDGFTLQVIGDCSWIDVFLDKRRWYNLEVIGNIYENQELIYEN